MIIIWSPAGSWARAAESRLEQGYLRIPLHGKLMLHGSQLLAYILRVQFRDDLKRQARTRLFCPEGCNLEGTAHMKGQHAVHTSSAHVPAHVNGGHDYWITGLI